VQMRGKCVVLAVLGHDVNWLTKLQSLRSQSGCLVFAYISEERFEVGEGVAFSRLVIPHVPSRELHNPLRMIWIFSH
jgi:hypothetical protein